MKGLVEPETTHWAFTIAKTLKETYTEPIICASGVSPSGRIHIGNLREAITTDFVYKALREEGADATFIFSWDDYDRFRKVPAGLPSSLHTEIGKPYSEILDPFGEYPSYALRWERQFENELATLGIKPAFIRQSERYTSGAYVKEVLFALRNRRKIGSILAKSKTQGMTDEELENYYPISVYSRFTGKDNTTILSFDDERMLTYRCEDTGKTDRLDLTKDHVVKLPWKIDWPTRWKRERVVFEPGGPDHASPGSSYEVSSQIAREVLAFAPPAFEAYGFIRIKGENGKMSSSSGNILTPEKLLEVYTPECIRWLYARASPGAEFSIALDKDVIRTYAEFDEAMQSMDTRMKHLIDAGRPEKRNPIPFRKVFGLGEATGYNGKIVASIIDEENAGYDPESVGERLEKSDLWSRTYCPELRACLNAKHDKTLYDSLSEEDRERISALAELISEKHLYSRKELELKIYEIPKREGQTEEEKKNALKRFFQNTYRLLFAAPQGPRLPTFIWASEERGLLEELLGRERCDR
jgi:lysyl-tRNA synthetase class 1